MNHIDLFSGIGGFSLAAQEVWGEELNILLFCEIDPFCQAVLRNNFGKEITVYGDIRELTKERFLADTHRDRLQKPGAAEQASGHRQLFEAPSDTQGRESRNPSESERRKDFNRGDFQVDLLTGGFPCQPFSVAGQRGGTADDRHLWPEMLRVIKDFKPSWVIAENVPGFCSIEGGLVFEQACLDLENEGYEVQPLIIPACAVNAPHQRKRLWILACHSCGTGLSGGSRRGAGKEPADGYLGDESVANSGGQGLSVCELAGTSGTRRSTSQFFKPELWRKSWLEVAAELCRMDDGLPAELDGLKLSRAGHRRERLKALGNAIVPQVAVEIMRGIKSTGTI